MKVKMKQIAKWSLYITKQEKNEKNVTFNGSVEQLKYGNFSPQRSTKQ